MQLSRSDSTDYAREKPPHTPPDIKNRAHKQMVAKRYNARLVKSDVLTEFHKLVHPLKPDMILQQIALSAVHQVQDSCLQSEKAEPVGKKNGHKPDEGFKYLDAQKYLPTNIERVQELRLDRFPRKRILDIGSGAGYFLFIAKQFGHDCLGLDTDDVKVYGEMMKMLGLKRVTWRIEPLEPLPDLGAPFDIITSYQMLFNRLGTRTNGKRDWWSKEHWNFFLRDLCTHLAPSGTILLRFNQEGKRQYIAPELAEFFLSLGAEVRRTSVRFDLKDGQLPQSDELT